MGCRLRRYKLKYNTVGNTISWKYTQDNRLQTGEGGFKAGGLRHRFNHHPQSGSPSASCSSEWTPLKREVHIIRCTDNCTEHIYVLGEVYIVHSRFPSGQFLLNNAAYCRGLKFNAVLVQDCRYLTVGVGLLMLHDECPTCITVARRKVQCQADIMHDSGTQLDALW